MNFEKIMTNNKTEDNIFCFSNSFSYEDESLAELIERNNLTKLDCSTLIKFNAGDNITKDEMLDTEALSNKIFALVYTRENGVRVSNINLTYSRLVILLYNLKDIIPRSLFVYDMTKASLMAEEAINEFNSRVKIDDKSIYTIAEFADLLSVTTQTLRNWDKNGSLRPSIQTPGGRMYAFEQSLEYFRKHAIKDENKIGIGYLVETDEQADNERKIKDSFRICNCDKYTIYVDKEGDIKERKEFRGIIGEILRGKVSHLMIISDNNAISLGSKEILDIILSKCGCKLIVI